MYSKKIKMDLFCGVDLDSLPRKYLLLELEESDSKVDWSNSSAWKDTKFILTGLGLRRSTVLTGHVTPVSGSGWYLYHDDGVCISVWWPRWGWPLCDHICRGGPGVTGPLTILLTNPRPSWGAPDQWEPWLYTQVSAHIRQCGGGNFSAGWRRGRTQPIITHHPGTRRWSAPAGEYRRGCGKYKILYYVTSVSARRTKMGYCESLQWLWVISRIIGHEPKFIILLYPKIRLDRWINGYCSNSEFGLRI